MKKLLILLIILTLAIAAGCGKSDKDTGASETSLKEASTVSDTTASVQSQTESAVSESTKQEDETSKTETSVSGGVSVIGKSGNTVSSQDSEEALKELDAELGSILKMLDELDDVDAEELNFD